MVSTKKNEHASFVILFSFPHLCPSCRYYTTGLTSVIFFISPDNLTANEAANSIGNIVSHFLCNGII